jgi:hypothetical protein
MFVEALEPSGNCTTADAGLELEPSVNKTAVPTATIATRNVRSSATNRDM